MLLIFCLTAVLPAAPTIAQEVASVVLEGMGQVATEAFWLPEPQSIAWFSHSGQRNFIVQAYASDRPELLVNTIGPYAGYRLLEAAAPIVLDIQADGRWRAEIGPIPWSGEAVFSGTGDSVSGRFDPPASGAWTFGHDGQRNFIVQLHCAEGRQLIQNRIGPAEGSQVITFRRGPCFWEVLADGAWSLAPR